MKLSLIKSTSIDDIDNDCGEIMNGKLFGTFGTRGIIGRNLTPNVATKLGLSLTTYLGKGKTIVIGYDTRTSSLMLEHAMISGIISGGCHVKRVGLIPTPVLSYTLTRLNADAGVMITASHNPPQYNGIKFWNSDGSAFLPKQDREIEKIFFNEDFTLAKWNELGKTEEFLGIPREYIDAIKKRVNMNTIKKAKFKVVVDAGNGAASEITPTLLRELGCQVVELNCKFDGFFPGRNPNPNELENLKNLIEHVKKFSADLGLAHDGDGDRVIFIDENGEYVTGDRSFALSCFSFLEKKRGIIVAPVATSTVIRDVAERVSAKLIWTPIGEPSIVGKMKELNADIGGEENGGVIFRDWVWAREGILTIAYILEMMAKKRKTFSELDNEFPTYRQIKTSVSCPDEKKSQVSKRIQETFSDKYEIITIDGVKLINDDGWLLLRPSGTEPIFRVFAEAKTNKKLEELKDFGLNIVKNALSELD